MNAAAVDSVRHPIWNAILTPARSVEVRAWLRNKANRAAAVGMRGPQGESVLHWAALSDFGLVVDLIDVGLDINLADESGRSPMDWVFERFHMTHEEGVGALTFLNRQKLRLLTDDVGSSLWRLGGRLLVPQEGVDPQALAMRHGLWKMLEIWRDLASGPGPSKGASAWLGWRNGQDAIHHYPWSPPETGRTQWLARWMEVGLSPDRPDDQDRTALWLAVERRLDVPPSGAAAVDTAIDELLAVGADPQRAGPQGLSPLTLPLVRSCDPTLAEALTLRLSRAVVDAGTPL